MPPKKKAETRGRIIDAAYDLFYRQGYQGTTMDQVIEACGLSKPTVYAYFPTKEELCTAYLEERRRRDINTLKNAIRNETDPEQAYMTVMQFTGKSLTGSNYRGCAFFNMIAELGGCRDNPIVAEAKKYVDSVREIIRDTVETLKNRDKRHAQLDVDRIANAYYLILGGTVMACQEYEETWPIENGLLQVKSLIS